MNIPIGDNIADITAAVGNNIMYDIIKIIGPINPSEIKKRNVANCANARCAICQVLITAIEYLLNQKKQKKQNKLLHKMCKIKLMYKLKDALGLEANIYELRFRRIRETDLFHQPTIDESLIVDIKKAYNLRSKKKLTTFKDYYCFLLNLIYHHHKDHMLCKTIKINYKNLRYKEFKKDMSQKTKDDILKRHSDIINAHHNSQNN